MGKIIRINAEMDFNKIYEEIEFSFEENSLKINKNIHELIGNNCDMYQIIPPVILHRLLEVGIYPTKDNDIGIAMLCDEDAKLKDNQVLNAVATTIYMEEKGYDFILGNCLIVGTCYANEGIEFCAIPEEMLERIRSFFDSLLGTKKTKATESDKRKAKQCIACVKLNKENGATLPLICPKYKKVCLCVKDRYTTNLTEESKEELYSYCDTYFLEQAFNKCWDNNDMPNLFNEMGNMMKKNMEDIRFNMEHDVFNQQMIKSSLQAWDIMVEKGDKELYTLEKM